MAFFTSEDLFNAIKTIVDKSISKVSYDKTIVCTIEDNSKASEGEYTVSDGSASFTAYSEKTNYTQGASVYVIIPQGNYENKKLIVGKYLGDDNTPYVYTPPTENYVDMTGNIITTSPSFSLLMNDPDKKNTSSIELNNINLIGYNRLGVKVDFQTLVSANTIIAGHYGLVLVLNGIRNDGMDDKETIFFDTEDMFGNPYNFIGATTQEKVFDISSYSEITDIEMYLYQNADFIDNQGQKIKYQITSLISGTNNLPDNLFASNIEISAGYDYSQFDKETILLYTLNSKIFSVDDFKRTLQARFITLNDSGKYTQMVDIPYVSKDGIVIPENYSENFPNDSYDYDNFIQEQMNIDYINALKEKIAEKQSEMNEAIDNADEDVDALSELINQYNKEIDALQDEVDELVAASTYEGRYLIHWYQWDMSPEVKDDLAGTFWKEIYPSSSYECTIELRGAAKAHERFKIIVEEIIGVAESNFQKHYYESEILEFTNENGSVETNLAVDLVSSLTLSTSDDYNGIYAIYGSNGQLMNQTDAMKDRYITVSYQSLVTGLTEFDGAESITWQVPGNNTMIIIPTDQDGLVITQDENTKIITATGAINASADDTDIIGENNIRGAKLRFRINPIYSQINTNNTVKCLITRQGFQYAAQMTMRFAPAGTNGTDYTLVLEIDNNQEYTALPLSTDESFPGLRIVAQLQDYENKPMDGQISLSFEDDAGLKFDTTNENNRSIIINAGETATILRNSQETSGYGMVVATTYVWVANKIAEAEGPENTARQIMLTAYLPLSYAAVGYQTDLIEGPIRVVYDGGGSNPVYAKLPYNLYNNGIVRNENISWEVTSQNINGEKNYIGNIIDGFYTPPVMLIRDLSPVYIVGYTNNNKIWSQRLLLQINRFGSSMLNRWDGSLTIDEENNQILSSIIGAGSKDSQNQFTGVIMGDIGKDMDHYKTGLYGYNSGQQAFSFLADGTATIGQAGKGALKFDGNKGTINAGNYLKDEAGMLLDFDDAQLLTKLVKIRGQAKGTASVLEIDGFEVDDTDKENETSGVHPLMRIGNKSYFLQSANWSGDVDGGGRGFKLDLGKNKIIGYDTKLQFQKVNNTNYSQSGNVLDKQITQTYYNLESTNLTTEEYNEMEEVQKNEYSQIEGVYYKKTEYNNNDNDNNNNIYFSDDENNTITNKLYNNSETNRDKDFAIFGGLAQKGISWDTKIIPANEENMLFLDSSARDYPLEIQSGDNKTFKLGWNGSMIAQSGRIGGWIINSNNLITSGGRIGMAVPTDQNGPVFWSGARALELSNNNGDANYWGNQVGFGVGANGNMYANKGKIGGWVIELDQLTGGKGYNQKEDNKYYYYYASENGKYYYDISSSTYKQITASTSSEETEVKYDRVEAPQKVILNSQNGKISAKTFEGYLDGTARQAKNAEYADSAGSVSGYSTLTIPGSYTDEGAIRALKGHTFVIV